jgi:HTH-type transcriptional regulator / antitoxin HigA
MTAILDEIAASRTYAALVACFPPRPIRNRKQAQMTCKVIERLMRIGAPSKDQLEYLELLSTLAEQYEAAAHPTPTTSLPSLLTHLIDSQGRTQAEVARAAGVRASTLSEVLSGKRTLSVANIQRLASYFGVDAGLFVRAARNQADDRALSA